MFLQNLYEIKNDRMVISIKTGNVIKFDNSYKFSSDSILYVYLIMYYDNTKCNIEFYTISNQILDENILLKNIADENIYGKKGIVDYNNIYNSTEEYDFIIVCKKQILA